MLKKLNKHLTNPNKFIRKSAIIILWVLLILAFLVQTTFLIVFILIVGFFGLVSKFFN